MLELDMVVTFRLRRLSTAAFIPDLLFGRRRRFLFHIVTEQHILITQIKPTARHHGMAEGGETAPVRLPEPAFLLVALRYGFDKRDLAALAARKDGRPPRPVNPCRRN